MAQQPIYLPNEVSFRFNEFDFIYGTIELPEQAIWYRAYDRARPRLSNMATCFGDMDTAWMYAKGTGRPLGAFRCRRKLRVFDMRFVQALLPHMLRRNIYHTVFEKVILALGLCSFHRQIELLDALPEPRDGAVRDILTTSVNRMREFARLPDNRLPGWTNPVEMQGVRIGITDDDYIVMTWLKALFGHMIDGIIAPRMPSPFHDQWKSDIRESVLMEELILFSPDEVLEYARDSPVGARMTYEVLTVPFQDVRVNSLQSVTQNPPHIRRQGGSHEATQRLPTMVRDAMGERLQSDTVALRAFKHMCASWKPHIQSMKRMDTFMLAPHICFPLLMPPEELQPRSLGKTRTKLKNT